MKKRILSTLVLWGGLLGLSIAFQASVVPWLLAFFGTAAQWEFHGLLKKMGYRPMRFSLVLGCLLPFLTWFLPNPIAELAMPVSLLLLLGSILCFPMQMGQERAILPSVLSYLYIPYLFHFFGLIIRDYADQNEAFMGMCVVLWSIVVAKFTDVGGLLAGKWFGKHLLAPTISPKKTWEGVVGGFILAMALGIILANLFNESGLFPFNLWETCLTAFLVIAVSIVSDLIESAWKRYANIKDSGACIPGIGGALDLIDSLLLVAPLLYIMLRIL